jgi:hypothetical protein
MPAALGEPVLRPTPPPSCARPIRLLTISYSRQRRLRPLERHRVHSDRKVALFARLFPPSFEMPMDLLPDFRDFLRGRLLQPDE